MIVVEPCPRCDTAIIVEHDPLQAFDIAVNKFVHLLWVIIGYL